MIETGYASIAVGAVLGTNRSPQQTATTKMLRFKTGTELGQLLYSLLFWDSDQINFLYCDEPQ